MGIVTALLSGAVVWWQVTKSNLINKGKEECVQVINEETVKQLEDALAAEKSARADLIAKMTAVVAANQKAEERKRELSVQLDYLRGIIIQQRETDETYRTWSDTALPDGVVDRLRNAAAGSGPGTLRDSSN
jgi:hypothetical protein